LKEVFGKGLNAHFILTSEGFGNTVVSLYHAMEMVSSKKTTATVYHVTGVFYRNNI